ncbi:MAG: serine/threonine protein kinase, partial [Bradymonadaceae bacterium]
MFQPGDVISERYEIAEPLGRGAFGEVHAARDPETDRRVALKILQTDSIERDPKAVARMRQEAEILRALDHPNLVKVFDIGTVGESEYLVMELLEGRPLDELIEAGELATPDRLRPIAAQILSALDAMHDREVQHRDIKPENIVLMDRDGPGEIVKLVDFGIAKAQGKTSQTQVGVLKGKFSYMSPEQVRGLHVDHRSDIFSLGIVLYEMLTLERLFLGESDFDTLEKIRKVEMSPPSLYNPNIPKELEDIVLKALAQNPDERYQSAGDLAHALERFMRNQDYYYKNADLAGFMKDAFQEDIEFEKKKLEYYKSLDLKPPDQLPTEDEETDEEGGLVWDEEEMETQIFDRNDSPPQSTPAAGSPSQTGSQAAQSNSQVQQSNSEVQRRGSRQSGRMDAVEVVGPDDEVDVVGPEDNVEAGASRTDGGEDPTTGYDRWSVEEDLEEMDEEEIEESLEMQGGVAQMMDVAAKLVWAGALHFEENAR